MLTQIINARILTPQGWLKDGSVILRDSKILEVTNCDLAIIGANVIDAKGMYVVPGGIEMHIHGGGGRDFQEGEEEAFRVACAAHAKYGTTSIYPTLSSSTIPMIEKAVAEKLVKAVVACPDGMQSMSQSMKGLVQTSTNLARIVSDGSTVKLHCLLRSSVNSEKADLGDAISSVFELAGAEVKLSGGYDGWKPNMASPILKAMLASYEALYGKSPAVMAIHAGLECGIIGGKYPNLDMISFGPTICYPHSPDEKVEIASVEKFYDFLLNTVRNAPKK